MTTLSKDIGSESITRCEEPFPIFVGYLNESGRTIERIEIDLEAFIPDHSTNVLAYGTTAKFDRIVKPGEGWVSCWNFPFNNEYENNPEAKTAKYTGEVSWVTFKD